MLESTRAVFHLSLASRLRLVSRADKDATTRRCAESLAASFMRGEAYGAASLWSLSHAATEKQANERPARGGGILDCQCVTLWIGSSLGPVERACLRSVLRHGHRVALYCYHPPDGVPAGVEIRDAGEIIAEDRVIVHSSGSAALFANWFRYELQRRAAGTWVDCDAYMLAPLECSRPYLMGEEESGRIANGVLRIPPDSPLLSPLLRIFDETEVPAWLPWPARLSAHLRLLWTGRTGLAAMPWGSAGPAAVSALAREHGVYELALAPDVLYPVHWSGADWIRDPRRQLEEMITERTVSVHLFNEMIKGFKNDPPEPGSFLARLHEEGSC
jgi:hypothetical protein